MEEKWYQIIGLVGFIIAGIIFIVVGIQYGDSLTIIGSIIWTASCIIWMIPLVRPQK